MLPYAVADALPWTMETGLELRLPLALSSARIMRRAFKNGSTGPR